MRVRGLPILGQMLAAQSQSARGQIGQLPRFGQQKEAGVIGDEVQTAAALFARPADSRSRVLSIRVEPARRTFLTPSAALAFWAQ